MWGLEVLPPPCADEHLNMSLPLALPPLVWFCIHRFNYLWRVVLCWVTQSRLTLCNSMDCRRPVSVQGDSLGKNTGVDCHALLQGIFPLQESNPGLLHCKQILYYLSHQGSPRILEWVAYPFSRGSFQPRSWTGVPALQADLLQLSCQGGTIVLHLFIEKKSMCKWTITVQNSFVQGPFIFWKNVTCLVLQVHNWRRIFASGWFMSQDPPIPNLYDIEVKLRTLDFWVDAGMN